ncbi:hypothetical protein FACS1894192_11330 [Bacilli bacterium]|nr:hypothetical protein FACS1894192_11330 [Bacilli bacterium]
MGLIYNPSESGELVSNFQANLTSCEQVIADLKKGNNHLIGILNSKQLGGAAFDAGLAMFSQLVIPTVNKVDISIQDIKTKLQQFSQYTAAAGGEILDEDKLNQQLEELRRQQASLTSQIHVYQNQARFSDEPDMAAMCYSYANDLSNFMGTVQDDIRKVEEKLKKLHELDMKTSSLFSEAQNEIQNLATAILAINSVNFDSSGNFSMKCSGKDLAKINKFLSDNENVDWKKAGKLIKGASSGTIVSVTVSGITYKIKITDLAKLKDILKKHKAGKFEYKGVSYFSKAGIKLKDFRGGKKSSFQAIRSISKKLEKPLDKLQNTKALKKVTSKIPSYKHSTINRDLANSKAVKSINKITGSGQTFKEAGKIAKGFKVAGWVGTAVSVGSDYSGLKSKGFSNGESAALTATHTAVSVAGSAAGRAAGTYVGAILGSVVPGAGTAVGAVVGGIVGSAIGGWFANKVNNKIDKSVKHDKKGLFGLGW